MNLSSEFRELVLESECQVFVKGKHQVLVCELSTRYCVCKWSSPGTVFAKGVLPGTLHLQMSSSRYHTYKVSIPGTGLATGALPGTALAKSDIIFALQRLTVKLGYTVNYDTL